MEGIQNFPMDLSHLPVRNGKAVRTCDSIFSKFHLSLRLKWMMTPYIFLKFLRGKLLQTLIFGRLLGFVVELLLFFAISIITYISLNQEVATIYSCKCFFLLNISYLCQ